MSETSLYIPNTQTPETISQEYPKLPAGAYLARIVKIIDLGTQPNTFDPTKPDERKLQFVFETVDELQSNGMPYLVAKDYSYKISAEGSDKVSGLTTLIETVNGNRQDKNSFNLINKMLQISVSLNDKGYPKITGLAGIPKSLKGQEYPKYHDLQIFYLEAYEQTKACFEQQPEFIKKRNHSIQSQTKGISQRIKKQ
jgi:hypothetical protein